MRAPAPPPKRRRAGGGVSPLLGSIAAVLAAGLAVAGLFFPIHRLSNTIGDGDQDFAYDLTWWGLNANEDSLAGLVANSTLAGLTLVAAAVLLVLGAVFVFLSGKSVRPGVRTAGRSLVSAGAAMLAGIAALQLIYSLGDMASWNEDTLEPGETITFQVDLGLYLPFGGVLLAIVATVLAHRGLRAARREPATPPMGIRMPRQYGGPGPMTGQQPALPGPGQSSGRFAPVPRPGLDPGAGQGSGQFAPVPGPQAPVSQPQAQSPVSQAPAEASLASRLDGSDEESTSDSGTDSEQDPDITQRTKVHTGPPETRAEPSGDPASSTVPPSASAQQGGPSAAPRSPEPAASMWAPGPSEHTTSTPEASAPEPAAPQPPTPAPSAPEAPASASPAEAPSAPEPPAAPASPSTEPAQPSRPTPEPPAPSTQGDPTPPSTPEAKPAEPGPLNLPPAPPAPELADEKNNEPG